MLQNNSSSHHIHADKWIKGRIVWQKLWPQNWWVLILSSRLFLMPNTQRQIKAISTVSPPFTEREWTILCFVLLVLCLLGLDRWSQGLSHIAQFLCLTAGSVPALPRPQMSCFTLWNFWCSVNTLGSPCQCGAGFSCNKVPTHLVA